MSAFNKANSALDSLEKELGIDLGFDFESDALGNTSHSSLSKSDDRSIASAPPKSATNNGMIHSHWLTTFFAGSLPAAQSAMLLDWALFNGERYAGTSVPPLRSPVCVASPSLLYYLSLLRRVSDGQFVGNPRGCLGADECPAVAAVL